MNVNASGSIAWVMQLNYNHLYYFHIAAVEGTVSAAAIRLGVTAATVSEQLRSLERVLGVELFERTQAGLKLTDSGRLSFEHTATMFRLGERLIEVLGHAIDESKPTLRVGVSIGVARSISATIVLPLFGMPECLPVLRTSDTVDLLRDLRAGLLELVLCEGEPPESSRRGLEMELVSTSPMVAIAAPQVKPAADWQDVSVVLSRATTSFRKDADAFLEAHNLKPQLAGEADDSLVLVEAALHKGLVAIVPSSIAREALESGRLRVLAHVDSTSAIYALYRDTTPSALARQAVKSIVEQARADDSH
ncbi:MAG: LysR family transcriptional regulator [Deltaproteobacteria bacterium]|nr:LysR family transcriptional regulator [Deltaproteobacteria bacterium]